MCGSRGTIICCSCCCILFVVVDGFDWLVIEGRGKEGREEARGEVGLMYMIMRSWGSATYKDVGRGGEWEGRG